MLAIHGGDALRPSMANGRSRAVEMLLMKILSLNTAKNSTHFKRALHYRYIAPLVPRRIAGDLRKRAIIRGTFGSFSYPVGKE